MSQQTTVSQTVYPITLTILPKQNSDNIKTSSTGIFNPLNSTPVLTFGSANPSRVVINNETTVQTANIPQFNHVPIQPIIVDKKYKLENNDHIERERRKIESDRLRSARYNERVKEYKKLGSLPTEKEKIIKLLLLCYPSLNELSRAELDRRVTAFIQSLFI